MLPRWHWKAATFSALIRCSLFFAVNATSGWEAASGAALAEFAYRFAASGYYSAITQRLSRLEPAWKANLLAILALPLLQHAIEYAMHWARSTPRLNASIAVSYGFTILSTLFNLYSMRRGSLIVGEHGRPVMQDILAFPQLLAGFLLYGPQQIVRACSR
ncbi:MAG: hypothetical protein K7J46_19710 [Bryobacter sp.]|jgi:hypothetical protein|nr:hypothetical protein [Bryobacter sp. CoA8 C33]